MYRLAFVLLFLTLSSVGLLKAQAAQNPCEGEENQMNMNLCAQQRFKEADAHLNVTWKKLLPHLDETETAKIKEVERLWIKFRDAHCDFEAAPFEGGSMQPLIKYGCLLQLTEERVKHLENLLGTYDN